MIPNICTSDPIGLVARRLVKSLLFGALIITIGIGFWGPLYHNYTEEPPKVVLVIIETPF